MTGSEELAAELRDAFPAVRALSAAELGGVVADSTRILAPAGTVVLRPGDPCETFLLVLGGDVRVHAVSASGRDITLYHVERGEMCALAALSAHTGQAFPAFAEVTSDADVLAVPARVVSRRLDAEEDWRRFAFRATWERFDSLLTLIDDVVFSDVPARLADVMLTQQADGVVRATHERLASEIGSSREVVSRTLKLWERQGIVTLGRGRIHVLSLPRLAALSVR